MMYNYLKKKLGELNATLRMYKFMKVFMVVVGIWLVAMSYSWLVAAGNVLLIACAYIMIDGMEDLAMEEFKKKQEIVTTFKDKD